MGRRRRTGRRAAVAALAALACLLLPACSLVSVERAAQEGPAGRLEVLSLGPVTTWDPQLMTSRQDMAFAGRVLARTLTAYGPVPDGGGEPRLVGDLATDTGTADRTLRTWSFTLRPGVTWQDGSPVTCADVKYGVSRSFAAPFSTQGLGYPLAALDIPKKPDGTSTYAGPWAGTGQVGFDRAVTCDGATITFRLAAPTADFDEMVSLTSFAPVKAGRDTRGKDPYAVFSNGPYQLEGAWDPSTGGTFLRNPHWSAASDPVRRARPTSIHYQEGIEAQTAAQRVISDTGRDAAAVTLDPVPPAMQQHVTTDEALRARSVDPASQFVDYLAPSFTSATTSRATVRRALAVATNRDGYVTALGGPTTARPAFSLLGTALPGSTPEDPFGSGTGGDPDAAQALLKTSGLTLPVPVTVAYRHTATAEKAMAALVSGWESAGFTVRLEPVDEDYFQAISDPERAKGIDVFWASWAPAWPSASTVLPPLFDSRVNLSSAGTGRDYGSFADAATSRRMTEIQAVGGDDQRSRAWAALDTSLVERVAYIGLAQHRSLYVSGSRVSHLAGNEALGGFVDLATIGVR